jgi:hypothetical protein
MSKRGNVALRTALYQAASMAHPHQPPLAEIYPTNGINCINITASRSATSFENSSPSSMWSVLVANLLIPPKYELPRFDSLLLV